VWLICCGHEIERQNNALVVFHLLFFKPSLYTKKVQTQKQTKKAIILAHNSLHTLKRKEDPGKTRSKLAPFPFSLSPHLRERDRTSERDRARGDGHITHTNTYVHETPSLSVKRE
jgi:hypothetical protein